MANTKSSLGGARRSIEQASDVVGLFEPVIKGFPNLEVAEVTLGAKTDSGSNKRPLLRSIIVVEHSTPPLPAPTVYQLLRELPKKYRGIEIEYRPPILSLRENA